MLWILAIYVFVYITSLLSWEPGAKQIVYLAGWIAVLVVLLGLHLPQGSPLLSR